VFVSFPNPSNSQEESYMKTTVMLSLPDPTQWPKERPTTQLSSFLLKGIIKMRVPGSCSIRGLGWTLGLQEPPTVKKKRWA